MYQRTTLREVLGLHKQQPIKDIPNQEGFRFVLVLEDGSETLAVVVKNKDGCHAVNAARPFELSKCRGWKKL